jgi:hypothetical protein
MAPLLYLQKHAAGGGLAASGALGGLLDAVADGIAHDVQQCVAQGLEHVTVKPVVSAVCDELDANVARLRGIARGALERGEDGGRGNESESMSPFAHETNRCIRLVACLS